MENKTCTLCKIAKHNNKFHKNFSESKDCFIKRFVKRYYDNKDKISSQQKINCETSRDKLLQKQTDYRSRRNTDYKELLRSYVEL